MALARKCTRCGSLYEDYHPGKDKDLNIDNRFNAVQTIDQDLANKYWSRETFDLCPCCRESLVKWLTEV